MTVRRLIANASWILDEATRSLVATGAMPEDKAVRLRAIMDREFPEAEVTGYEHLIAAMKNQEKDRHVAAAEVKASAQVITTWNLKNFGEFPVGIDPAFPCPTAFAHARRPPGQWLR